MIGVCSSRVTVSFLLNHYGYAIGKLMMSSQNSVLLQPIVHLFKVFKSSDLPTLQFTGNVANLYESSYQREKRGIFRAC